MLSILLVDDSRTDLLTAANLFGEKHRVISVGSPLEAEVIFGQQDFDLVVSDYVMEEENGIELLNQCQKAKPEVATILMTAYSSEETAILALRGDVDDYLIKPLSKEDVNRSLKHIERIIKLQRRNAELIKTINKQMVKTAEHESRLAAIVESATDGIVTINRSASIVEANPSICKMFGYDKDELIGQNVNILVPEPFQHSHDEFISNYLYTGIKKAIGATRELFGLHASGQKFPVEISISESRTNEQVFFTAMIRDISQRRRKEQKAYKHSQIMEDELNTARSVQDAYLPTMGMHEYLETSVLYVPAGMISGDFYSVRKKGEGVYQLFLGDATGHGVSAGFITMKAAMALATSRSEDSPSDVIGRMNEMLVVSTSAERFMTAACLNMHADGQLQICTAGHLPVMVLHQDTGKVNHFRTESLALGIRLHSQYKTIETQIKPGDRICIYSDGVTDCYNHLTMHTFGEQGLSEFLSETASNPVADLPGLLNHQLDALSGDDEMDDDVSCLFVEYKG